MDLDPRVELLADAPITSAKEDLLARGPVAQRLVELIAAAPVAAPRVVALLGPAGSGKTSTLNLAVELLAARTDVAFVTIDAAISPTAHGLADVMADQLTKLFTAAGVVGSGEKMRNAFSSYAGVVSGLVKAVVKVDVESALKRSQASLREEILDNAQGIAKRIAIVVDHVDRIPAAELPAAMDALAFFGALPFVALLLALDGHSRCAPGVSTAFARLVQVELALPPADRTLLARVVAGGITHLAARTQRDLDAALPALEPHGLAAALLFTPRDAKRAANALSAALPLVPDAQLADATLSIVLRTTVPELDVAGLDATLLEDEARIGLCRALTPPSTSPRAIAAGRALRMLLVGEP